VSRHEHRSSFTVGDLLLLATGAGLGLVVGYFAAERVGRVNSRRVVGALERWKGRHRRTEEPWTDAQAERLESRVLDALRRDAALGRRPVRVRVLEGGIVELSGRVAHPNEVALAGDVVRAVDGVRTVLNHVLVPGADVGARAVPGPSTPLAARS
jgi:hypothetical protein